MRLADQGPVITGAGRGLGEQVARAFCREGAKVVLASEAASEVEAVAEDLRARGAAALAAFADGREEESVRSLFERTRELGVLKALGMRPRGIVGLIAAEAACLTTIAVLIGLALGGLLDWYLVAQGVDILEGDLTFNGVRFSGRMHGAVRGDPIVKAVVISYVVALLAALWPALRAARLDPVQSMRQE